MSLILISCLISTVLLETIWLGVQFYTVMVPDVGSSKIYSNNLSIGEELGVSHSGEAVTSTDIKNVSWVAETMFLYDVLMQNILLWK